MATKIMKVQYFVFSLLVLSIMSSTAFSANTVFLVLKANGTAIEGEPSINSIAGEDVSRLIEVMSYQEGVKTAISSKNTIMMGRREYSPIVFTKRIDKASPLISKALALNEEIEAVFRFYETDQDGTERQKFEVRLLRGRIVTVERTVSVGFNQASPNVPSVETVGIVFAQIEWEDLVENVSFIDNWQER